MLSAKATRRFGIILIPLGVLQGAWGVARVMNEGLIWQSALTLLLGLIWIVQGAIFLPSGRRPADSDGKEQAHH